MLRLNEIVIYVILCLSNVPEYLTACLFGPQVLQDSHMRNLYEAGT